MHLPCLDLDILKWAFSNRSYHQTDKKEAIVKRPCISYGRSAIDDLQKVNKNLYVLLTISVVLISLLFTDQQYKKKTFCKLSIWVVCQSYCNRFCYHIWFLSQLQYIKVVQKLVTLHTYNLLYRGWPNIVTWKWYKKLSKRERLNIIFNKKKNLGREKDFYIFTQVQWTNYYNVQKSEKQQFLLLDTNWIFVLFMNPLNLGISITTIFFTFAI
jgi:hypothetical protein